MSTPNQPNSLKPFDDEILDVKKQSLYARLKRLFSIDVIVRNVGGKQLKIKDTDSIMYATDRNSLRDRFNRIRSTAYNAYTRDFALSYQAARMDLFRDYDCVGPDTIIPLPDGTNPTIAELAEKYKDQPQERFLVFSYDHETNSVKLGRAYHPRKKKGKRIGYKVTFDNGQYVVGSLKHPFMMRDGSYKMIYELRVGDSVMPFYQKDFYGHGYRHVYDFSNGWKSEHVLVAEQFNRKLNDNEVVHHKDFNKGNNLPDNLQIMTESDHKQYHCKIIADKLWSPENKPKTLEKVRNSEGYKNRKFHRWNGKRTGENNPFFGKTHSEKSNNIRSETLKKVFEDRNQTGEHNPKYRGDITFSNVKEKAFEFYKENSKINLWDFIKHIHCDHSTLQNRLKKEGHDWKSFKQEVESTLNHKIVSIESIGEVDIYDITVEEYKNFATDSCFVGNTMDMDPILSSALDIYSDECLTYNEVGKMITVHSNNNNVKRILENLFDEILNVRFNLWSWTRNMPVKYDSYIPLLDGRNIRIDKLSKEMEDGKERWVYSIQDGTNNIVPGKVVWCGKNYISEKIVKVVFDDDSFVETSPEHPFILRNGEQRRADELKESDSLMPFYRKLGSPDIDARLRDYEMVYNPSGDLYEYTHRCIAKSAGIEKNKEKRILHHIDFNKYNNKPTNLMAMDFIEHKLLHAKHCKEILHTPEITEKRMVGIDKYLRSEKRKIRMSKEMTGIPVQYFTEYNKSELHKQHNIIRSKNKAEMWKDPVRREIACQRMKEAWIKRKQLQTFNHKVKRIDIITEMSDVYCMTVVGPNGEHDRHNFAICGKDSCGNITRDSGVFVKNCKYGDFYLKLYVTPEYGIYMVEPISAYNVERIENSDPSNKRYVKFQLRPTDTSQAEILENYEVAHFRLISDSNFLPYGKCQKFDTFVSTEFGRKMIKDICVGEKVWSYNTSSDVMELSSVKNVIFSGEKDIIQINTRHFRNECSYNHPILIYSDGKLHYEMAENIKLGDLIAISKKVPNEVVTTKIKLPPLNNLCAPLGELPEFINSEFSQFVGFMIGDGWVSRNIMVEFANGPDELQNSYYKHLLNKFSGKQSKIITGVEGKCGSRTHVYSSLFAKVLELNEFVGNSHTKRIPEWVFNSPYEIQYSFLKGLIDADGSVFIDKWNCHRFQLEMSNEYLIKDVKYLLFLMNKKCSNISKRIRNITEICGTKCKCEPSYYIYFYLNSENNTVKKFHKINSENITFEPVVSLLDVGKSETYDIQVDSSNSNFVANGIVVHNSMIEGARRVWKQLSLMEDAMLISRIMRAPERRIFYTDIGNIPSNEVDAYMQRLMDKMKKVPYIDEQTGEYNLRFNLQNMIEDYYIPVRGGDSGTKIDTLAGMEWTGIDDLEYIKTKMMAALKIPKAFLGYEEGISGKATLASEDVRFARTIQRLQRIIASELSKIAIVHLYSQGYRDESLVDFEIELTNPSTIFEQEKIEIWQDKIGVAIDMVENKFFSYDWVYKNIFNMSEDDIKEVKEQVVDDAKQKYRLTMIEEDGDDPAKPFKKIGGKGDKGDDEGGIGDLDIGGGGHGGGGGGSLPDLDDLGDNEEGEEGEKGEKGDEDTDIEDELPDNLKKLKESTEVLRVDDRDRSDRDQSDRDQTGEKETPAIAEDPIGKLARNETPKKKSEGKPVSAISHNYEGGSPLRIKEVHKEKPVMDRGMIGRLAEFLTKTHEDTKKELLAESQITGSKSLLDPSNILE